MNIKTQVLWCAFSCSDFFKKKYDQITVSTGGILALIDTINDDVNFGTLLSLTLPGSSLFFEAWSVWSSIIPNLDIQFQMFYCESKVRLALIIQLLLLYCLRTHIDSYIIACNCNSFWSEKLSISNIPITLKKKSNQQFPWVHSSAAASKCK